jgi:predicted secreted hydrolase
MLAAGLFAAGLFAAGLFAGAPLRAEAPRAQSGEPGWSSAAPGYAWSFPRDHWSHPGYRNEWWYFTGHVESATDPPRRFGFQFTVFRVGVDRGGETLDSAWDAANLWMGHASITDKSAGRHWFTEVLYREVPFLAAFGTWPDPLIARARGPAGTAAEWTLHWNGEGFDFVMADEAQGIGLELSTRPRRPLIFQGPGGVSRKSDAPGAASLYYTFTRLATAGVVVVDGKRVEVAGTTWMDMEFSSNQLTGEQVGWDWFGLRLDDGRDLMLYQLRRADGGVDYGKGTLVDRRGEIDYLEQGDWELGVEARWTSPESGIEYPAAWRITLGDGETELVVRPELAGQENRSRAGLSYWEGAVTLLDREGRRVGEGYVELTGYGEDNRPPI